MVNLWTNIKCPKCGSNLHVASVGNPTKDQYCLNCNNMFEIELHGDRYKVKPRQEAK